MHSGDATVRLLLLVFFLGHVDEAAPAVAISGFSGAALLAIRLASRIPCQCEVEAGTIPLGHPLEFKTARIFSVLLVVLAALARL
jgi:hypothetical protein